MQRIADFLTYACFQAPAVLAFLGYAPGSRSAKSFGWVSTFLGSTEGRLLAAILLSLVGVLFARYVQLAFRRLGESDLDHFTGTNTKRNKHGNN